mgnify:CR=1 FL=1
MDFLMQTAMQTDGIPVLNFCALLRERDDYFDFRTLVDPVTLYTRAIMWQTGHQRMHAQLYCDNLFLECRGKETTLTDDPTTALR